MEINKIKQRLKKDENLAIANARLAELYSEMQAAEQAHAASQQELCNSFVTANNDSKALAYIERRDIAGVDSLRDAEARDRGRVTVIKRAIELQNQRVNQFNSEISATICRELKEEHAKLGDSIADAALRLREANKQEMSFRNQLEGAGIRVDLPALVFLYFETLAGDDSFLDRYLAEQKQKAA